MGTLQQSCVNDLFTQNISCDIPDSFAMALITSSAWSANYGIGDETRKSALMMIYLSLISNSQQTVSDRRVT